MGRLRISKKVRKNPPIVKDGKIVNRGDTLIADFLFEKPEDCDDFLSFLAVNGYDVTPAQGRGDKIELLINFTKQSDTSQDAQEILIAKVHKKTDGFLFRSAYYCAPSSEDESRIDLAKIIKFDDTKNSLKNFFLKAIGQESEGNYIINQGVFDYLETTPQFNFCDFFESKEKPPSKYGQYVKRDDMETFRSSISSARKSRLRQAFREIIAEEKPVGVKVTSFESDRKISETYKTNVKPEIFTPEPRISPKKDLLDKGSGIITSADPQESYIDL